MTNFIFCIILQGSCENIPAGYEPVSLIEALNGPYIIRGVVPTIMALESPDALDGDTASATKAAEILNRSVFIFYF